MIKHSKQTPVEESNKTKFRNIPLNVLIVLVNLFLLVACGSNGQSDESGSFSNVNAEKAKAMITDNAENDQFVVLDTRTPSEYSKGHLADAKFFNYNASDYWDQINKLDKNKVYLVYCHSGGRSGKTLSFMKQNGFKEAHNLSGGIVAWKRAGYAVVTE